MRPRALNSSFLALGVPAALGALLVGTALLAPAPSLLAPPVAAPPTPTGAPSIRSAISRSSAPEKPSGRPEVTSPLPAPGAPVIVPGIGGPLAVTSEPPALFAGPPTSPPSPSDDRLARAEQLRADGDVPSAVALLDQVRATADPALAAHAAFLIARAYLLDGDVAAGTGALRDYLRSYPDQADAVRARFALAAALSASGATAEALPLYQQYLAQTLDHTLDGYAWLALARDLDARNDPAAIDDYRRAVGAGLPAPEELDAATKVAAALLRAGNVGDAVDWYVGLADRYQADDPIRAGYLVRAADTAARNGEPGRAADLVRQVASDGAASGPAAAELFTLPALGVAINDIAVGEAFLRSGDDPAAVAAFGDYIDRDPNGAEAATARFERGQALLGEHANTDAIAQLQKFIDLHPSDARVGEAKSLIARAQARSGAPDANGIPAPDPGVNAAFAQGWADYEALDVAAARSIWQGVRQRAPTSPSSPPALFWLAKLELKAGDTASALRDLRQAWDADPGDYYAFRAREVAASLGVSVDDKVAPAPDPIRERADFESWLARWTNAPADAARRPYLGAAIAQTDALDRIRALMDLGLRDQVDGEYQAAADQYWSDGRSLYALADTLSQAGLDAQSMKVAYRLLMISPAPNAYQSPVFLQRLVYPFPYRDLVEAAARQYGVDPRLLVALIRQESAFDPRATSAAGAHGLTQFMPATAQTLAPGVGLPAFSPDDLGHPAVAIKLGAAYLASLSREFGGNPYLAIAAYNAGAGNVHAWLGDNPRGDFDLLAEEIPFQETRDYVRNVYRFYQEYLLLYSG